MNALTTRNSILIVCTANVCRSPFITTILTAALRRGGPPSLKVGSAGTRPLLGHPIADTMADILRERRLDPPDIGAVPLTKWEIESSALILTSERSHRAAVVSFVPSALSRTFTVRQFARLLDTADVVDGSAENLPALVAAVAAARGRLPSAGIDDDVPDPWRGPRAAYDAAVAVMDSAVDRIAAALVSLPPSEAVREAHPRR